MDGRVALITGAGRGIGSAMAEALASVGCAVAIQDVDEPAAKEAAAAIAGAGGRAIALGGDIGDLTLVPELIEQVRTQLGGLHVLINNAAIQMNKHWLDVPAERIEQEFRANLFAPIELSRHAVPSFRAQRWGRIVNVGSVQGRMGNPHMLAYSLTKAALEKLTSGLARDLAADGITVNNLAPGWFVTRRNEFDLKTPEIIAERGKRIPIGRLGQPHDCVGAALLLCSDAGAYITGQTLYVSGGM